MNAYTQKEAVEQLADQFREEADLLRRHGADRQAASIERVVGSFEEAVHSYTPEWFTLAEVQAVKGWSGRWLRDHAAELAEQKEAGGQPLARKNDAGRWLFHLKAVEQMSRSPAQAAEEVDITDLEGAARELALDTD